jgi:hypothetical protein
MPARRSKRLHTRRESKTRRKKSGFRWNVILFIGIVIVGFIYLSFNTKYWTGNNKLTVVSPADDGLALYIFDPVAEKIITVTIPGDTEVISARNLGVFRVKNLWQLAINEKAQGILVGETVTRNFRIPVIAWAEKPLAGFASGRGLAQLKSLVVPFKTNLTFADKLRIFIFGLGVSEFKVENIDLSDSGLLSKTQLIDGGEGYRLSSRIPDQVIVLASDYYLTKSPTMINIIDSSGSTQLVEDITEVAEALGAKVVKIEKREAKDINCEVWGKEENKVNRIALIFGCKSLGNKGYIGNFDIQIEVGKGLARRF